MPGRNSTLQSYLQWRPVVYSTRDRDLSASTDVNVTRPVHLHDAAALLNNTMMYAFYGAQLGDMLAVAVNVTFGGNGDGFYKKTKYQAW
jgi:hypothetical protein